MARARTVKRTLALAVGTCLTASACAGGGLASLPLPAPGNHGAGGYTLTAVFTNALNLPDRAKVKLGGADVGELQSMEAHNYTAVTRLRIMGGVQLPKGSTAELRSATPLGDVFVSVRPPEKVTPGTPLLKDGDTLGIDSTSSAATIEALLSSAAIVVNGGAVRNLTNLVNGIGKATGDQGQAFGDLIAKTNHTLGTLNARSDQISEAMKQTSQLATKLNDKNDELSALMAAANPATDTLAENTSQIADLVTRVGSVSDQLQKFPSVAGTDTSGRSVIGDLNTIAGSWNDVVLAPDARLYHLNRLMPPFVKMFPSSAWSVNTSIDRLILGHIPDIGFAGDDGLHGPKWSNFNQIIGSFKYTLFRLQERIVGQGQGVPQVPVIPSPTEPGQLAVAGPPEGPPTPPLPLPVAPPAVSIPGQPAGPPPGPAPAAAPAPAPAGPLPAEAPQ